MASISVKHSKECLDVNSSTKGIQVNLSICGIFTTHFDYTNLRFATQIRCRDICEHISWEKINLYFYQKNISMKTWEYHRDFYIQNRFSKVKNFLKFLYIFLTKQSKTAPY